MSESSSRYCNRHPVRWLRPDVFRSIARQEIRDHEGDQMSQPVERFKSAEEALEKLKKVRGWNARIIHVPAEEIGDPTGEDGWYIECTRDGKFLRANGMVE